MKPIKFKSRVKVFVITAFVIISSVVFYAYKSNNFEITKNLDIYYTLFRELNLYYVDEIDSGDMIKTSIDEMLKSLDPYTVYIPESKMEDYKFMTTGQYGGIGALIRNTGEYVIITDPYKGFPADKAGLKAGDKIVSIDGVKVKGKNSSDVSELLKGQPNTKIVLQINRPGVKKELEKEITREKITIKNVPYFGMVNDNVGYIRLSNFTSDAGKEVKQALIELKEKNNANSVILDLRGNPGGLLQEAVLISNIFVEKGQEIVTTKGKVKQWFRTYKATQQSTDTVIPLVVLVNQGSASASEIVSGVMQDLDRGVVIGTRTFGKGLVQTTRPLSYNSKLKVTTAKYYIPSGRCIQALDYQHRNEDGSVGNIPDSLITKYSTKNDRPVYDGGGITPDIKITPNRLSHISISLLTKSLIFDFATEYVLNHDTVKLPKEFEISDQAYEDFKSFLTDKEFDYTTKSESTFKELESIVKQEKYYDDVKDQFAVLKEKLAHDKQKDLFSFKNEITELLSEEIVGRHFYMEGRIEHTINHDDAVKKAVEVLNDSTLYISILEGTYIEETDISN